MLSCIPWVRLVFSCCCHPVPILFLTFPTDDWDVSRLTMLLTLLLAQQGGHKSTLGSAVTGSALSSVLHPKVVRRLYSIFLTGPSFGHWLTNPTHRGRPTLNASFFYLKGTDMVLGKKTFCGTSSVILGAFEHFIMLKGAISSFQYPGVWPSI